MNSKVFALIAAGLAISASSASAQLTQVWANKSDAPGNPFYLVQNDNNTRGASYDAVRDKIYVATRTTDGANTGPNVVVIDPAAGTTVSVTSLGAAISGGALILAPADLDDDATAPKLYMCNVTTDVSATALKVYRLTDPTSAGTLTTVFNATIPLAVRVGDSLSVVGSGVNTEIWLGTASTGALPQLIRLKTADGNTFTVSDQITLTPSTNPNPFKVGLSVLGTGVGQRIFGKTTGLSNVYEATITTTGTSGTGTVATLFDTASTSLSSIGSASFSGRTYVVIGPGSNAAQQTQVWDVTGTPASVGVATPGLTYTTTPTNGNATGAAFFDTTRKRAGVLVSNAALASYSVAPNLAVSDWTSY